jgi:hypothetical protein
MEVSRYSNASRYLNTAKVADLLLNNPVHISADELFKAMFLRIS